MPNQFSFPSFSSFPKNEGLVTYLSLQVHLWVPVGVKENDNVGSGQVDAQPASSCGQHEDELLTVGTVVLINEFLYGDGDALNEGNISTEMGNYRDGKLTVSLNRNVLKGTLIQEYMPCHAPAITCSCMPICKAIQEICKHKTENFQTCMFMLIFFGH